MQTTSPKARNQLLCFLTAWLLSLGALFAGAAPLIRRYSHGPMFAAAVLTAFGLQLGLYWLPGFPALRARFEIPGLRRRALLIGAVVLVPYVVYAVGTHAWIPDRWLAIGAAKLVGLAVVVLGVYALVPPLASEPLPSEARPSGSASPGQTLPDNRPSGDGTTRRFSLAWQDVIVMLVVAAPVYVGFYRNIFPVPVYLDVMARLFVVSLAAFAVLSLRELPGVGFHWRLELGDWIEGGKQLVFYSIIAVPLGFAMRFIAWHPRAEGPAAFAFSYLGIFLFIAVAEELFFRGILQNLLEKTLSSKYAARGIAAGIFGLSHIHHNFPNWRYVIMAAIAGWFYGTAWHNRRSIMASCATHAAVDALWRHFFTL
jgi:membrane protease YdiL (CAAX protease family)